MTDAEIYDFLEHHGVKGMQWGKRKSRNENERKATFSQRRAVRRKNMGEVKDIKKKHDIAEKAASKDPNFKREVKLTSKGKGVSGATSAEKSSGGLLTGRVKGKFLDSKGEPISEDFANAVLTKAIKTNEFKDKAKAGALFAGALLAGAVIAKRR